MVRGAAQRLGPVGPAGAVQAVRRGLQGAAAAAAVLAAVPGAGGAVGPVTVELSNIVIAEKVTCPPGTRAFGGFNNTACITVEADAFSPAKKEIRDVDVFGRVRDVNGENALDQEEASDSGRISNIKRVEPGKSHITFGLIVSKKLYDEGQLTFKQFKGVSYPGAGLTYAPITDCEPDEYGECPADF